MVKGITNAFDDMEFCLVIDLTVGGNWAVIRPPRFATRCDSLKLPFTSGSKYLQSARKVTFLNCK